MDHSASTSTRAPPSSRPRRSPKPKLTITRTPPPQQQQQQHEERKQAEQEEERKQGTTTWMEADILRSAFAMAAPVGQLG